MCDDCARAIEYEDDMKRQEYEYRQREEWENREMEEHYRKHPHG